MLSWGTSSFLKFHRVAATVRDNQPGFTSHGMEVKFPQWIGGQSPTMYNLCVLGHVSTEVSSHLLSQELVKSPDAATSGFLTQGALGSAVGAHIP